jgi:hypothetical protein
MRTIEDAGHFLRPLLDRIRSAPADENDRFARQIISAKDEVIARYKPIFSPDGLSRLNRGTMLEFLRFENNRHWYGLDRHGGAITADMERLRETLAVLVDESFPIRRRIDQIKPQSERPKVRGLGPATLTAILHVVYPDSYGVLNRRTEEGLEKLGLWTLPRSDETLGEQYERINHALLQLATQIRTDLWTLDVLWWRITIEDGSRYDSAGTANTIDHPAGPISRQETSQPVRSNDLSSSTIEIDEAADRLALPSGLSISEPTKRLMRFCEEEFPYYDGIASRDHNRIEPIDVLATISMNSFVNDASKIRKVHRGLAERCDAILREIPLDADLLNYDPDFKVFQRLLESAVQAPGVLVPVATKVLHRKRPRFIPMLDNVVLKHYLATCGRSDWLEARSQSKRTAASVGVAVAREFRNDLRAVESRLVSICKRLHDCGYPLTPVRTLEILVWTETEPRGYYFSSMKI